MGTFHLIIMHKSTDGIDVSSGQMIISKDNQYTEKWKLTRKDFKKKLKRKSQLPKYLRMHPNLILKTLDAHNAGRKEVARFRIRSPLLFFLRICLLLINGLHYLVDLAEATAMNRT
jgi:hypothetical protein